MKKVMMAFAVSVASLASLEAHAGCARTCVQKMASCGKCEGTCVCVDPCDAQTKYVQRYTDVCGRKVYVECQQEAPCDPCETKCDPCETKCEPCDPCNPCA